MLGVDQTAKFAATPNELDEYEDWVMAMDHSADSLDQSVASETLHEWRW